MSKSRIGQCECCEAVDVQVKFYDRPPFTRKTEEDPDGWDFCNLCASTMVSHVTSYPNQFDRGLADTLRTICFVGNEILKKIGSK